MTKALYAFVLLSFSTILFSQEERKSFVVKQISERIIADGILDEPIWQLSLIHI